MCSLIYGSESDNAHAGGQNEAGDLYAVRVVISIKFVLQVVVLNSAVWY